MCDTIPRRHRVRPRSTLTHCCCRCTPTLDTSHRRCGGYLTGRRRRRYGMSRGRSEQAGSRWDGTTSIDICTTTTRIWELWCQRVTILLLIIFVIIRFTTRSLIGCHFDKFSHRNTVRHNDGWWVMKNYHTLLGSQKKVHRLEALLGNCVSCESNDACYIYIYIYVLEYICVLSPSNLGYQISRHDKWKKQNVTQKVRHSVQCQCTKSIKRSTRNQTERIDRTIRA